VGNEENEYPVLDPNTTMINITNELSDAHKKNLSKRKLWTRSLRKSWGSYKTQLTGKYKQDALKKYQGITNKNLRRHRKN
jgi:hypothetical protein